MTAIDVSVDNAPALGAQYSFQEATRQPILGSRGAHDRDSLMGSILPSVKGVSHRVSLPPYGAVVAQPTIGHPESAQNGQYENQCAHGNWILGLLKARYESARLVFGQQPFCPNFTADLLTRLTMLILSRFSIGDFAPR